MKKETLYRLGKMTISKMDYHNNRNIEPDLKKKMLKNKIKKEGEK